MVTESELQSFHEFALAELKNGGISSLEECVRDWQEYQITVAAIQEAQAEVAAGMTIPVEQVEAELRMEFGLHPRRPLR